MAKIYTHTLTAPDSSTVPLTIYVKREENPIIIMVPGVGVSAHMYSLCARILRDLDYTVIVMELRGQGESRPRPSAHASYGMQELSQEDIAAVVDLSYQLFPCSARYIIGHSMGGLLSLLYSATAAPDRIQGVGLVASGITYYKNYGLGGMKILLAAQSVLGLVKRQGYKPPTVWEKFGAQSGALMKDWATLTLNGCWDICHSTHNYQQLLARMQQNVYALSLSGDHDVPARCTQQLMTMIPHCHVRHDTLVTHPPLGHNGWLTHPWEVAQKMHSWIFSLT